MIWPSSGGAWTLPSIASAVGSVSSGAASTPRTCLGPLMRPSITYAKLNQIGIPPTGLPTITSGFSVGAEGSAAGLLAGEKGRHDGRELARSVDHRQMASALKDNELAVAYAAAEHLTGRRR